RRNSRHATLCPERRRLAFGAASVRVLSCDAHSRSKPWEKTMTTKLTRSLAGISVPDSPLIADAIEYAQKLSEPYLFNHAMRSWLFAVKIRQARAIECDDEVVAVGAILHDIGLTSGVPGDNRFEVNGANAARSFIKERGLSDRRAQL